MSLRAAGFVALSAGVHGLALALLLPDPVPTAPAGGGGAVAMVLGTAEADRTAGAVVTVPALVAAVVPAALQPVPPEIAQPSLSPPARPADPQAVTPATVAPSIPDPTPPATSLPALPSAIAQAAPGPGSVAAAPPVASAVAASTESIPAPADPALAPVPHPPAPSRSLIPPARAPAPQVPPVAAPSPGNDARDARRGAEAEGVRARAQPGQAGTVPDPGAGGADAYAAAVMHRIRSLPAGRNPGRGAALVAFTIGPGGGLTSVSIARSSGNPALDQAALAHIRRAAPFPPPPSGVTARFTFDFVVR